MMTCTEAKMVLIFSYFNSRPSRHLPYWWSEYFGKIPNNQLNLQTISKLIQVQTSEQKCLIISEQKYFLNIILKQRIFVTHFYNKVVLLDYNNLFPFIHTMQSFQENPPNQQFRTVVMGYRLHGQLLNSSNNRQVFFLSVVSSTNKEEKYQIRFDQLTINSYKFVSQLSTPKKLYDHLSKVTKLKLKFDPELKTMTILYDKIMCAHEIHIELLSINQPQIEIDDKEIETTFSQEKQQIFDQISNQKSQQKVQPSHVQVSQITEFDKKDLIDQPNNNSQNNEPLTQTVQTQGSQNVEDKIEQLRVFLQMTQPKQQQSKQVRQQKNINYTFSKSKQQPYTLYQYALTFKADLLAEIIESQQLLQTQQIVLKRNKLLQVPPFNQISLINIKFLSLQENKLTKICNLDSMPHLQKLNLDGNKISVIENLSHLTNLKLLKLGNNDIKKIQGLDSLTILQTLWLDFNSIQKIQGLKGLKNLKNLNLSFNMIQTIQNLEHLTNLEQLLINENKISKIQNLEKLEKLTKLSLSMNMIEKVKGLRKLLFLQVVHLNQNKIEYFDRMGFEELNWLKMLKDVKLNANPIEWTEQAESYIQRLRIYGVKVSI